MLCRGGVELTCGHLHPGLKILQLLNRQIKEKNKILYLLFPVNFFLFIVILSV